MPRFVEVPPNPRVAFEQTPENYTLMLAHRSDFSMTLEGNFSKPQSENIQDILNAWGFETLSCAQKPFSNDQINYRFTSNQSQHSYSFET